MEPNKFDEIIKRASTTRLTRLETLRGLAAGAAAAVTGAAITSTDADAKKRKKRKKGKKGKKGLKGLKGGEPGTTTTTTEAPATTTTTEAPTTTTTPVPCIPDGTPVYKDEKKNCCNGYCEVSKGEYICGPCCIPDGEYPKKGEHCCAGLCVDGKGKCKPCPTTTTTTTTATPPICKHSDRENPQYGCKNVCTQTCKGFQCEEICGAQDACPVGQGGGNPCSSTAYCDPGNYWKDEKGECHFSPSRV